LTNVDHQHKPNDEHQQREGTHPETF